LISLLRL